MVGAVVDGDELGEFSLATDTETVAVDEADVFFSFVEVVVLLFCPCSFIHVSPRALAKWSSTEIKIYCLNRRKCRACNINLSD